eukprot:jgi/Mesvir1/15532/Mv03182-RA.1
MHSRDGDTHSRDAVFLRSLNVQETLSVPLGQDAGAQGAFMYALARHCPELQYLFPVYRWGNEDSLVALARGCPKLKYLNLALCRAVTRRSLAAIGQRTVLGSARSSSAAQGVRART